MLLSAFSFYFIRNQIFSIIFASCDFACLEVCYLIFPFNRSVFKRPDIVILEVIYNQPKLSFKDINIFIYSNVTINSCHCAKSMPSNTFQWRVSMLRQDWCTLIKNHLLSFCKYQLYSFVPKQRDAHKENITLDQLWSTVYRRFPLAHAISVFFLFMDPNGTYTSILLIIFFLPVTMN